MDGIAFTDGFQDTDIYNQLTALPSELKRFKIQIENIIVKHSINFLFYYINK